MPSLFIDGTWVSGAGGATPAATGWFGGEA
jgi:hypothetical protein